MHQHFPEGLKIFREEISKFDQMMRQNIKYNTKSGCILTLTFHYEEDIHLNLNTYQQIAILIIMIIQDVSQ